ncbi:MULTISPECIES: hypothetical protein [unclassified Aureimonas]|uniref:hypothetical protein n=1 Tax=unclassified Aureimonas TaxID=2615206 RepID=UPI00071FBA4A|nr:MULTISPECIES: hypothetical protein [unclassified Aureimonas]ALN74856.1 hypothetical protein M673_19205 [Aureimonas sp. AU20]
MDAEEERRLTELARGLTRDRELASGLSLPFVTRLLDLALLELAMVWHGKERGPGSSAKGQGPLEDFLQLKLRVALLERDAGAHYRRS